VWQGAWQAGCALLDFVWLEKIYKKIKQENGMIERRTIIWL